MDVATFALGSPAQRTVAGHAVVLPSATESFSFPLAEAIATGLPVIAADSPFAREVCGDGAWYYDAGDVAALTAALRRLLDGERPAQADPGRRRRLSWPAHVDGLAALVRAVGAVNR